jgi:hypothetical protein
VAGSVLVTLLVVVSGTAPASGDRNLRIARAFVHARCNRFAPLPNASMWEKGWRLNALYGDCGGGDGRDQHVWFFVGHRFVGEDDRQPSNGIIGLWRDPTHIAFMYVLYRRKDPECCPTGGGAVVRFHWNGRRFVALDPLPPRVGKAAVGR